jgi:hypothetical protein
VVDHKARSVAEAVGAEARPVAVASRHQQVDPAGGSGYDLPFCPAAQLHQARSRSAKALGRPGQDGLGLFFPRASGVAAWAVAGKRPAEEARCCATGDHLGFGRGHVEQHHLCTVGEQFGGSVDAPLPGALDQPDDHPHRAIIPPI